MVDERKRIEREGNEQLWKVVFVSEQGSGDPSRIGQVKPVLVTSFVWALDGEEALNAVKREVEPGGKLSRTPFKYLQQIEPVGIPKDGVINAVEYASGPRAVN